MREILTAASAAGVAVAFGSPIGGVLFSIEVRSSTTVTRRVSKQDRKWVIHSVSKPCGGAFSVHLLQRLLSRYLCEKIQFFAAELLLSGHEPIPHWETSHFFKSLTIVIGISSKLYTSLSLGSLVDYMGLSSSSSIYRSWRFAENSLPTPLKRRLWFSLCLQQCLAILINF